MIKIVLGRVGTGKTCAIGWRKAFYDRADVAIIDSATRSYKDFKKASILSVNFAEEERGYRVPILNGINTMIIDEVQNFDIEAVFRYAAANPNFTLFILVQEVFPLLELLSKYTGFEFSESALDAIGKFISTKRNAFLFDIGNICDQKILIAPSSPLQVSTVRPDISQYLMGFALVRG